MKKILIVIIFLFTSCEQNTHFENKNLGSYTLLLPQNWKKVEFKSIDTEIYAISSGSDTLLVEQGEYISEFTDLEDSKESFDTLNKYLIQKISPKLNNMGIWGIYVSGNKLKNNLRLSVKLNNIENLATIKKIFASLQIEEKCNDLKICNQEVIGKIIYSRECFNCHGDIGIGFSKIALGDLVKKRDSNWLQNWLQNNKFREMNRTNSYISFVGLKNMNCEIKILKETERNSLVLYLKSF
jgi:hypothetical protein